MINLSYPERVIDSKHCVSRKGKDDRFRVVSFSVYKLGVLSTMHTQLYIAAMDQFIETNRGGKNLHFEGYVYTKIEYGVNSLQF